MQRYKEMLASLLTSRKFNALVTGVLGVLSQDKVPGAEVSEKSMLAIAALIVSYIYALGQEDKGKAAAKLAIAATAKK